MALILYEVKGKEVKTKYKVVNKDTKKISFGLGGHPAYKCEYSSGKYRLEFEDIEDEIEIYQLQDGLVKLTPEKLGKFFRENRIFLDKKTFENDALVLKNLKSTTVYLKTETKTVLAFHYKGFPYLGIWSKPEAAFICIEPWLNTADKIDSTGKFEEKENLIYLNPEEVFETEYSVEFFEN